MDPLISQPGTTDGIHSLSFGGVTGHTRQLLDQFELTQAGTASCDLNGAHAVGSAFALKVTVKVK